MSQPAPKISGYLIPQKPVRLVAFTGSTAVGRHLTTLASDHMTPVLMELGGHAAVIVCEDTNVHIAAVSGAVRKMRNAGQVCTSPTRFLCIKISLTTSRRPLLRALRQQLSATEWSVV